MSGSRFDSSARPPKVELGPHVVIRLPIEGPPRIETVAGSFEQWQRLNHWIAENDDVQAIFARAVALRDAAAEREIRDALEFPGLRRILNTLDETRRAA